MTDFREQYKEKSYRFRNANEARLLRADKHEVSRKKHRAHTFNENRNISESVTNTPQNKEPVLLSGKEDRLTRLAKWKVERDRRKKEEKLRKKPPFKVGVFYHRVYSPITKDGNISPAPVRGKSNTNEKQVIPNNPTTRITRATQKRLMAKAEAAKKPVFKASGKNMQSATNKEQKIPKRKEPSFAPSGHKFKAPVGLPQMPLFGRVPMLSMSPIKLCDFVLSPIQTTRNRRTGTTDFTVHEINSKENATSPINRNDECKMDNTQESSIEEVSLKVSSDEQEVFDTDGAVDQAENNVDSVDNTKKSLPSLSNNASVSLRCDSPNEPVFFSPYVVASRGKSSARKEQQVRRGFSLGHSQTNDIPTKDTVMQNLNISVEEEERTAQYFLFILNKEIERLIGLCDKWSEIKSQLDTTEDGQYQINQAIGQTTLLINKKFERFRRLVSDCETGKGEMLVTCKDLQGFWDMMYMEIKDCDSRFEKLEKLRAQHWVEEQPVIIKPVVKKKAVPKKKVVPTKPSSIRAFLAAKKKKLALNMENADTGEECTVLGKETVNENKDKYENGPNGRSTYRKSKSFGPNEQIVTPTKRDTTRMNLLQKVQLSETSKRIRSPLTVMKISKMCKTPEVQLDGTISYVNSDQTPGKSILKCSKDLNESESRIKATHKVNFDDHVVLNNVSVDEETQTKMNLAAALARIDNFNIDSVDDEVPINAERKLNFDDSFEKPEIEHDTMVLTKAKNTTSKDLSTTPVIHIQSPSPSHNSVPNDTLHTSSPKRSSRKQSSLNKSNTKSKNVVSVGSSCNEESADIELNVSKEKLHQQHSTNDKETNASGDYTIILRNRIVNLNDSSTIKRRSSMRRSTVTQDPEHKENKTPSRGKRRSSVKVNIKDVTKTDLVDAIGKISIDEDVDRRRRSTRKSVKFTAKECTGCTENKAAMPMTPHVRRSTTRKSESKRKSSFAEDLISWETPEKPPERVRRSRCYKKE